MQIDATEHAKQTVVPLTVTRLMNLAPGQTITYYRGMLTEDIQRSQGTYKEALRSVRDTAQILAAQGKVSLGQKAVEREKTFRRFNKDTCAYISETVKWTEFRYSASGLV